MVIVLRRKTKKTILFCVISIIVFIILLNPYVFLGIGRYRFGRLSVKLPKNFEITKISGVKVALSENYPFETDNITFVKDERSYPYFSSYSETSLSSYYSRYLDGFERISEYKRIKIDNKESIIVKALININDRNAKTVQVIIFDFYSTYVLTFTIINDKYNEIFDDVIDSIKFGLFKQRVYDPSKLE